MTPEEQKTILEKRIPTKKVRCKNWPACKDPNCIFSHPTETVSFIRYFILFIYCYSVLFFQLVLMEINVAIFIQVFLANMVFSVQELDVLIHIQLDLTLVWECIQIW